MLTTEELERGFINIDKSINPVNSHLAAVTALRKMQELLFTTATTLTAEEALVAIEDYLDGLLGEYKKRKITCKTDLELKAPE